jgi:hypothetical protein
MSTCYPREPVCKLVYAVMHILFQPLLSTTLLFHKGQLNLANALLVNKVKSEHCGYIRMAKTLPIWYTLSRSCKLCHLKGTGA